MTIPAVSFVTKSGSGKTTLLEQVIAELKKGSIRVFSAVMVLKLIGLFTVGMQKTVPAGVKAKVQQIESELSAVKH